MEQALPGAKPLVSVIIPIWNVETYLRQCLDSVVGQTLGLDRLEIVAIDDGSTDSSGSIVDEYAERYSAVKAVHQTASGGPGRPRNVGLENATGRYVFFLDADDYLGTEALERLTSMAERNGSDVVLAKMVGLDGRTVPGRPFRRTVDRADLADVYSTLSVLKLYRRDFVLRTGCHFAEGLPFSEDVPFAQRAYLEADVISVVADYDCYYQRRRWGSQSNGGRLTDFVAHLDVIAQHMDMLGAHTKPGPDRDALMLRHISDVQRAFYSGWVRHDPAERRRTFDAGAALIKRWATTPMYEKLPPNKALRVYCLENGLMAELEDIARCRPAEAFGNPVVEGKRIFARYPHFRDEAGIPDAYFDITKRVRLRQRLISAELKDQTLSLSGESFLSAVGGETTIMLRRRWPKGPKRRFDAVSSKTPDVRDADRDYPDAGFRVDVDLRLLSGGRLPPGVWEVLLNVGTDQVRRTAPLRLEDQTEASLAPNRTRLWRSGADLFVNDLSQLHLRVGPGFLTPRLLSRVERADGRRRDAHTRLRRAFRWRLRRLRRLALTT